MSEQPVDAGLSSDRLTTLWQRIKQHRIAQWTVGYVAVAYGIQHAVTLTTEAFDWPHAVTRISMLLLVLGVPLAMVFAWYHGERTTRRISAGEMTLASLLLVLISLVFYAVVRPSSEIRTASAPVVQEASVTAARSAAASPKGAISVAVLPFLNLSSDKEQEFFSDGMTEEITAALAKVPDLRVVARTSAFEFKGKNVEVQNIGQQLHATHLIEGSVRKAGNRLRITAQLIKADDGTHVWAEDYDRELTDVFAIQEDIARAITSSLHMTLALKPGENLVNNRNINPAGYQEYLRARNLILDRDGVTSPQKAIALLEPLVARYPDYAPAWLQLGTAFYFLNNNNPEVAAANLDRMEASARRAIELDPAFASAYEGLAVVLAERGKWVEAEEQMAKATSIDPNANLNTRMLMFAAEGRLPQALQAARQLQIVEPYVPAWKANSDTVFWLAGDTDGAIALAKALPDTRAVRRSRDLARMSAALGRYREAADLLESVSPANEVQKQAVRLLRLAPNAPDVRKAPYLENDSWVYLHAGAPERALEEYQHMTSVGFFNFNRLSWMWHSSYAPARKTERFKNLVRHLGLVEFWRAKGWPPQCHPTTGDDFECQ